MNPEIIKVQKSFGEALAHITTPDDLEKLSIEYLGRKGHLSNLFLSLKNRPDSQKKTFGQELNKVKTMLVQSLDKKRVEITKQSAQQESIDVTIPGTQYPHGSLHLVTYAIEEISRIFQKIGFIRQSYHEVEWEYFAFESLNMPPGHPARDDFETFFVDHAPDKQYGRMVLTPHTSSGQVREMWRLGQPPVRMINIAKTYRPNWDATHVPMFHQFEGLCIDEGINITHLKGTIEYFAKAFFGEKREIRLRPFHFQFTEPSFEVDITCDICDGKGIVNKTKCKVCKSGWLELGGAGMVHPNVLKTGKINAKKYHGWAFGFGIERVFMMKQGLKVDDIRILYSGDIRFLEQF